MGLFDDWDNPLRDLPDFLSPAYEDDEEQVDGQGLPANDHYDS